MKRILIPIILMLALAACEARAEIDVRDDGSGTFGFSFVIEDQFIALLQGFGKDGDPFDEFKKSLSDSPVPFKVEEFPVKGARGIRATAAFKNIAQLKSLIEDSKKQEASPDNPLGGGPGFGTFTLEQRSGGWFFEALSEAPDLGELGGSGGSGGSSFDPSQIASILKISFKVTLPGRSTRTTADDATTTGGRTTFTWKADLTKNEPMELVAVTKPAGGIPIVPLGAALVALIVGGGVALTMSRRKAAAVVEAAAATDGDDAADAAAEENAPL